MRATATAVLAALLATLGLSSGPSHAEATAITFPAYADATLNSVDPGDRFGDMPELTIGEDTAIPDGPYRSLVGFDLSGLSGKVASARLQVHVLAGTADGVTVSLVEEPWSEETASWDSAPSAGRVIGRVTGSRSERDWLTIKLDPDAIPDGMFSVLLDSTADSVTRFDSRETARPPELEIEMSAAAPTESSPTPSLEPAPTVAPSPTTTSTDALPTASPSAPSAPASESPLPAATQSPAPSAAVDPIPTPESSEFSGPIFEDDFQDPAAIGEFLAGYPNWGAYPSGWLDTSGHGTYSPEILSVHDGVLDMFIHTSFGVHKVAAPYPRINSLAGTASWSVGNDQLYGRYAVRFRADPIPGYKTAWLLWPKSEAWPRDGEIDFPEGDLAVTIGAFMHHQDGTSGADQDGYESGKPYGAWHTAVIEWTPTRCEFFLDGVSIGKSTSRIPNTPMHWVLQTETMLDGSVPLDTAEGHVLVDWVGVWSYAG